ncbi:hypothetical protein JOQ06_001246, partial [Pogonophryne albipinna]
MLLRHSLCPSNSHTEQMSNHRFQEYLASLRPCLSPGPTGKKAQSPNWNTDPADSTLRPEQKKGNKSTAAKEKLLVCLLLCLSTRLSTATRGK